VRNRDSKRRGPIDWQAVRDRLARATAATEAAVTLSPERARAVLQERARSLARVPPVPPAAAEVLEVVTFGLAEEHYAVETRFLREVAHLGDFTPVPGAPDFLVGVMNLRGEILDVLDLRRSLGIPGAAPGAQALVLVLGGDRAEFGVVADAVHEVRMLRREELHPAPATCPRPEYLRGVTAGALPVLDGEALLADGRLFIDQGEDAAP
jgi:purine-binding chemotaxis protein CheW